MKREETTIMGGTKMIECEACDDFLDDDDDIEECFNCGMQLCKQHYQQHMKQCGELFDREEDDY